MVAVADVRVTDTKPLYRLPYAALGEVAANRTVFAEQMGYSRRTVQRWTTEGIPYWAADEVATKLGMNPIEIWGTDWERAEPFPRDPPPRWKTPRPSKPLFLAQTECRACWYGSARRMNHKHCTKHVPSRWDRVYPSTECENCRLARWRVKKDEEAATLPL